MNRIHTKPTNRVTTGVSGLDSVLHGGLLRNYVYLVRGAPGVGKTTLGLHYLAAGAAQGEKVLFISLSEPEEKIRGVAKSIGISLDGVTILDLSPKSNVFSEGKTYDIFDASDVEREPTARIIGEALLDLKPERVFIDPTTLLRYMSRDSYQFRRQTLAFLRFMVENNATVIWTSEQSASLPDDDLQFTSDGVINLEFSYGGWAVSVFKSLGSGFQVGRHSMRLSKKGMEVFPRLIPEDKKHEFTRDIFSSGVPTLDEMMRGGIEAGTVTIISGPTGIGKTTLGAAFLREASRSGKRSVLYSFEEEIDSILTRCDSIQLPLRDMIPKGALSLVDVEPLRYSPDEFASLVCSEVERENTRVVMLDSVSSYKLCLRGEDMTSHLHALSKHLQNSGVAVILVNEVESITGEFHPTEAGISYMSDNIIFCRYFEHLGLIRKALCILKKRMTDCDKTLREFDVTSEGICIGDPLTGLQGILGGIPMLSVE